MKYNQSSTKLSFFVLFVLFCAFLVSSCNDVPSDEITCEDNRSVYLGLGPPNLGTLEGEGNAEFHWSPGGDQLIFRIRDGNIFIVNVPKDLNGASIEPQILTSTAGFDLSWSPNGREIIFASRANTISLVKLDASSREEIYLTKNEWDTNPVWSPDAQKIGFYRRDRLHLLDLKTDEIVQLTSTSAQGFTWAPDSSSIAYISSTSSDNLFVLNLHDMDEIQLTSTNNCEQQPSWFPDAQRLAFMASYEGNRDIFLINADGTNLENITRSNEDEMQFSLSPDGNQIAYTLLSSIDGNLGQYKMSLHIKDIHTGNSVEVAPEIGGDISLPQWSPEGSRLAFLVYEKGEWRIELVDASGSNLTELTKISAVDK